MSTLVTPELEARAIAWRRHLHAHPELSFAEHETSRYSSSELLGGLRGNRARTADGDQRRRVPAHRSSRQDALHYEPTHRRALPIQEETGL